MSEELKRETPVVVNIVEEVTPSESVTVEATKKGSGEVSSGDKNNDTGVHSEDLASLESTGKCQVPIPSEGDENSDDSWKVLLKPERLRKVPSLKSSKWELMVQRLILFKQEYSHTKVPNRWEKDPALGSWVSTQRRQYKLAQAHLEEGLSHNTFSTPLTLERANRLESIGFVWETRDPRHVPWETRFEQLKEYKQKYGNCVVPISFKENKQLSNWVSTQRQEYKLLKDGRPSRLRQDRIDLLEDLGFVWEAPRGGSRFRKASPDATSGDGSSPKIEKQVKKRKKTEKMTLSSMLKRSRVLSIGAVHPIASSDIHASSSSPHLANERIPHTLCADSTCSPIDNTYSDSAKSLLSNSVYSIPEDDQFADAEEDEDGAALSLAVSAHQDQKRKQVPGLGERVANSTTHNPDNIQSHDGADALLALSSSSGRFK